MRGNWNKILDEVIISWFIYKLKLVECADLCRIQRMKARA